MDEQNPGQYQTGRDDVQADTVSDSYVVAAIDIGTTYSGYAFSFKHDFKKDPTQVSLKQWTMGMGSLISNKTPTCVLFNQHDEFDSFGYEAEEVYTEKLQDDPEEAKKWSMFRRFKMKLYNNVKIHKGLMLTATNGNTMPALTVVAASIRFMIDAMIKHCEDQSSSIKMDDIAWVLTVPAIWSDPAKKFMRVAAEKAGIKPHKLTLALEPEAAALYVRYVPFEKPKQSLAAGYDRDDEDTSLMQESMATMSLDTYTGDDQRRERRHDFTPRDEDEIVTGIEQCRIRDDVTEGHRTRTSSRGMGETQNQAQKGELVPMSAGVKYMVIDAGGGTIDIAVHEMREDGTIREIFMANGGDWGGTKVDEAFREFLMELVSPEVNEDDENTVIDGRTVLETFEKKYTEDDLELKRDFELKKRGIKKSMRAKIKMRIPPTLHETFEELNPNAEMKRMDRNQFNGSIRRAHDKLQIDPSVAYSFFEEPLRHIVEHLEYIFSQPTVKDAEKILMVGGFSESPLLVSAVRDAFPGKHVIVPRDAGLAVLKGAVIFGHDPAVFSERISKFTYGVRCEGPFNPEIHPQKFKYVDRNQTEWCHNLFDIHVKVGNAIRFGEPQSIRAYFPSTFVKDGVFNFSVFGTKSEEPMFVTEQGVHKAGQVTLKIPLEHVDYESEIIVSLTFSGTELEAVAEYTKTGQKERSYIGYLE
ncbi:hypothetical protein FSP39_024381 [Pinctada imbricata]|uniref:Uncharacterized protein n=1 Tax=Pinctada imbricata TaxID=66713 RepID=A0AA88YPC2_PINIB|nr:hypothetical protein FSP39_024381 [Pinctada imbricata]